jgi:hypothetical protein
MMPHSRAPVLAFLSPSRDCPIAMFALSQQKFKASNISWHSIPKKLPSRCPQLRRNHHRFLPRQLYLRLHKRFIIHDGVPGLKMYLMTQKTRCKFSVHKKAALRVSIFDQYTVDSDSLYTTIWPATKIHQDLCLDV